MPNESSNYTGYSDLIGELSSQTITLRLQLAMEHVRQAHDHLAASEQILATLVRKA